MAKKSIVPFIAAQFPSFIGDTDTLLIPFMEAYYEWLSQDGNIYATVQDLSQLNDIDEAIKKFSDEFQSEYLSSFPNNMLADKALVIKHIKDLYKAKGTPKAVRLLIRILFNEDSEIFLPSSQIFKTSAAKWNRDVTIRFKITSGFLNAFENVQGSITTEGRFIPVDITKIERVDGTTDQFEAYIAIKIKLQINAQATLTTSSFTGELVRTIVKKTVKVQGNGFAVGDIFEINKSGGTGTVIKVTKVSATSGLKSFEFVKFGTGYTSSFITELLPISSNVGGDNKNLTIQRSNGLDILETRESTSDDNINRFQDEILISKFTYVDNINYFENNTYVGEVVNQTTSETVSVTESNANAATIFFELGYVHEYPGYYSTNVGFTSDASYLQDGEYYQQFSYVVKTSVPYADYLTPVNNLVHPAGLRLFGDYLIDRQLNILVDIENRLNLLEFNIIDTVSMADEITSKILAKNILDTVSGLETILKTYSKAIVETSQAVDQEIKTLTKNLVETIQSTDEHTKTVDKNLEEILTAFDTEAKSIDKPLEEVIQASDIGCAILNGYYTLENTGPYWQCGYAVDETIMADPSFLFVDSSDSRLTDGTDLIKANE
jgi:hypothetical protein